MIQQSQAGSVTDGRVDKLAHVCLHSKAFCDSLVEGLLAMNRDFTGWQDKAATRAGPLCTDLYNTRSCLPVVFILLAYILSG